MVDGLLGVSPEIRSAELESRTVDPRIRRNSFAEKTPVPEEHDELRANNPYQSPSVGTEGCTTTENTGQISYSLMISGAVLGSVCKLTLLISYFGFHFDRIDQYTTTWAAGAVHGVGIALLIHTIRTRQFSNMMPGHWRLIAASTALVAECLTLAIIHFAKFHEFDTFLPAIFSTGVGHLLAAVFYFFVIRYNNESRTWRAYAWFAMIYYLAMTVLYPINLGDMIHGLATPSIIVHRLFFLVLLFIFIAGLIDDWRKKTHRDFLHYSGIILGLVLTMMSEYEVINY